MEPFTYTLVVAQLLLFIPGYNSKNECKAAISEFEQDYKKFGFTGQPLTYCIREPYVSAMGEEPKVEDRHEQDAPEEPKEP